MRRGEIGHHHHVAGPYLIRFAQEAAWREDHRREANGAQVDRLVALAMANRSSVINRTEIGRRRILLVGAPRPRPAAPPAKPL
jgi:hypothetical protein